MEHVDVLIVGAGLSGIGAASHLRRDCPDKSFAILEARGAIGGTWDLFRYPGVRSDSDMFTLGYSFRPWTDERSLADGPSIRSYIRDTARDHDLERQIRFHHRVVRAEWSSGEARWKVEAERSDTGETVRLSAGFVFMCSGYYRYDEGYSPDFPGIEGFGGQVIHPQHWPEDLDYDGKRVVVIGSGATAVTLVPAMAGRAAHVTMLQRSPSYIVSIPARDPLAVWLRRILPEKAAYWLLRWKNVLLQQGVYVLSRRRPRFVRALLRKAAQRRLPKGYDVDRHFGPTYEPWDQRLCVVPEADLFNSIRRRQASVVTDRIETFTETGLKLESGEELEADIVVTATGLNLLALGGLEIAVDGSDVSLPDTVGYKGMMLSGVPNMAIALGYTNASWTLKCDLTSAYVARLLRHMDEHGYAQVTPRAPESLPTEPFIDLKAGYVLRAIDKFPKQGPAAPWRLYQSYPRDIRLIKRGPLEDDGLEFSAAPAGVRGEEKLAA